MGISVSKGTISMCYQYEGKINSAHQFAQEALTLARETGDTFVESIACSVYVGACYLKGLFDETKTHFLEFTSSYEKSASIAWSVWVYAYLGSLYIDLKEYDEAVNCYRKIISIMENVIFTPSLIKLLQSSLVRAKVLRHDQDIELNELFAGYQSNKLPFCEGQMARTIGDILLNIDDDHLADAELWFQKAINADTNNGMRWQLATDHAYYSDFFQKKGDTPKAKEQLTQAIDIFRECGADGWVTKTEEKLASIS